MDKSATASKQPELREAYRVVFGSPEGKKVLESLLQKCLDGQTPNDPGGDPYKTAFLCGQHSIGTHIRRMMKENSHG